ncbi:uncharacterized protein LOC134208977 [Armigeres subalbatus]|uniref:uncharacterized protein LOC134208977 n=1 Tax=Armigeres subalbatus TaxID=124917 RepID=UPI002ED25CC3
MFFAVEINGIQEHQKELLLQVLNSKRLLIDHVEILEECFDVVGHHKLKTHLTASKFAALGSIPVGSFFLSSKFNTKWIYSLSTLFATAYGICYGVKWFNRRRYQQQRKWLLQFIRTLERFEMAVKKTLIFVNESQHYRGMQVALEKSGLEVGSLASNCARCCVETIKEIHSCIKKLEQECALTERWNNLYAPIESLEDCELFSESSIANVRDVKSTKDYYNIFAYMQSQFLTRLALSVICGLSDIDQCNLPELCARIDNQTASCLVQFNAIVDANRERVPRIRTKTLPLEMSHLRTLSISLAAKLYNTVHRYNRIEHVMDEILLSSKDNNHIPQLQEMELDLEDIINNLSASTEECQRLMITLKKLIHKDDENIPLEIDAHFKEKIEQSLDMIPSVERIYSENDKPCVKDEFFAVDGTIQDWLSEDEHRSLTDDLESINSKIVKRQFKPVLVQLRERIEPIGVEFKEREKRALKDKGIEVVDSDENEETSDEEGSLDFVPIKRTVYGSDSEDDQEPDERNAIKFQKSIQRYDEVRGFLANKEQVNIFGLKPMESLVNEDVLE